MDISRLGQTAENSQCVGGRYCPQILKVDKDFAAVGPLITEEAVQAMPPGPGVGPKEGVVRIPFAVMVAAIPDILAAIK